MRKSFISLFMILPVCIFSVSYTVNHNGSGNFTTIQAAIDYQSLANGDSIIVWSCIDSTEYYPESLIIYRDISFTLCSRKIGNEYLTENTCISGDSKQTDVIRLIRADFDSTEITIAGFTISHLDGIIGRGIKIYEGDSLSYSTITFDHCNIQNNGSNLFMHNGGGLYVESSYNNPPDGIINILNCNISNNRARKGAGIFTSYICDFVNIKNTIISGNTINDSINGNGGGISVKNLQ